MTEKIENNSIAFWGPRASGKTSLIAAFARELTWYSKADPDFSYKLSNNQGLRSELNSEIAPEFPQATPPYPVDHTFYFQRIGKKNSIAHNVSSFQHTIQIRDNSGENLFFRDSDKNNDKNYEDYLSIRNFIILIDPTAITKMTDHRSINGFRFTPEQYLESLQRLLRISLPNFETLRLAICISKSDALHTRLPADLIIENYFENKLFDLLRADNRVNYSFFKVSSVGMITTISGKSVSNISNLKENYYELKDPEKWNPINVVSPFFWIFENIERELISKHQKKNPFKLFDIDRHRYYIPYPHPRPL